MVLETKIKKDELSQFVEVLVEDPQEKYVKLLKALINCDGEAMISNQAELSNIILKDKKTKEKLIFPLRLTSKDVEIYCYNGYIKLINFKEISQKKDNGIIYNFFCEMIHLLADLCLNKNFLASEELNEIYTFQICFHVLSSNDHDYSSYLRCAFINLTLSLWIEINLGNIIEAPNMIRTWEELGNEENNTFHLGSLRGNNFQSLELLKTCTKNFLVRITEENFQNSKEVEKNLLTYHFLLLCKYNFFYFFSYSLYIKSFKN